MASSSRILRSKLPIYTIEDSDDDAAPSTSMNTGRIAQSQPVIRDNRKRRNNPDGPKSCSDFPTDADSLIPTKSASRITKKTSEDSRKTLSKELFLDRFPPDSIEELGIHPNKVSELTTWLKSCRQSSSPSRFLLLTGPPGSGKTAAVHTICNSLGFDIVQWEGDTTYEMVESFGDMIVKEVNECTSFFKFLKSSNSNINRNGKRILLVENFPHQLYNEVHIFHSKLSTILHNQNTPVIFIMTSSENWSLCPKRIFPATFLMENGIDSISFNSVADRYLKKAVDTVIRKLRMTHKVNSDDIKKLLEDARGDIRCAINKLQFIVQGNGIDMNLRSNGDKADVLDAFHLLGRILYAKRLTYDGQSYSYSQLPSTIRPPLERDVNQILEVASMSTDTVMCFLHEHEPRFSPSISNTRRVLESYSLADSLSNRWEIRKNHCDDYAAQISARSTMFYNYGEKSKGLKGSLYQFTSPNWTKMNNQLSILRHELYQEMGSAGTSNSQMATLMIPALKTLEGNLSIGAAAIVSYLNRPFTFSWQSSRNSWDLQQKAKKMQRIEIKKKEREKTIEEKDEEKDDFIIEDSDEYDSFDEDF